VGRRRILIVDDHPIVRRGLRAMLAVEPWVEDVFEAATVEEAVREAVCQRVDVIAMDVELPDGNGVDATRTILRRCPDARVLILTYTNDEDVVDRAMRAGAAGYVLKETDPDDVVDALRIVGNGGRVMGPKISSSLQGRHQLPADLPPPFNKLTTRELDIVVRLECGDSNATIAKHLGVSEKTVRNALSTVFNKLAVADRTQAALLAQRYGITADLFRPRPQ
jgi:two-component system, NarL family, nitrate/nitrite response regulator NarL